MTDDAWQGMLFGSTTVADPSVEDVETDADELRVCALNVNSPSAARGQRIVDWLLATRSNVLVLTEMRPSDGGRHILTCLQAEGFTTTCAPGWTSASYLTAIATRHVDTTRVTPAGFDPRIVAVDIATHSAQTRLVGLYGPTNGMTDESSTRRREFQSRFLDYLGDITTDALCVIGDLNVIEPDHDPHIPAFRDHDYAFYTGLLDAGLRDAFRDQHPTGREHSWFSPRLGSQRLDHCLVSTGAGDIRTCALDHSTRSNDLSDHAALHTTLVLKSAQADARADDTS